MTGATVWKGLVHASISVLLLAATSATAERSRVVIDAAGRQVEIPARVERVFAAGPPAAVAIYMVAPELLLGWPLPLPSGATSYLSPSSAELPFLGRLTGRSNTASLETLISAKPDLIVDIGEVDDIYVSLADQVQRQTGIPYLVLGGRLDATDRTLETLGDWVGRPDRGRDLAARASAILSDVQARISRVANESRPRVYLARGPSGLETSPAGSIHAELITLLGARNVAEASLATGSTRVSMEQILRWSPDVILALDPQFVAASREDVAWRSVPAVRDGRVYVAPELPFGWIDAPPGANRLLGVRWAAMRLYPDLFSGDVQEFVRDFFGRFYHVTLDAKGAARLLGPADGG